MADKKTTSTISKAEAARAARDKDEVKTEKINNSNNAEPKGLKESDKKPLTIDQKKKIGFAVGGVSVLALSLGLGLGFGLQKDTKIMFITDQGSVNDRSFNQQGWEATKAFGDITNLDVNFNRPSSVAAEVIKNVYADFYDSGVEMLVLSGFMHSKGWAEFTKTRSNDKAIFIDDGGFALSQIKVVNDVKLDGVIHQKDSFINPSGTEKYKTDLLNEFENKNVEWKDPQYENTLGLTFSAEEAGFEAGIIAWLDAMNDKFKNDKPEEFTPKVSGWVGKTYSTTVDFFSGFEHAIALMNAALFDESVNLLNTYEEDNKKGVELVAPKEGHTNDGKIDAEHWATGDFATPEAYNEAVKFASNINKNKKASSMIVIAGPQAQQALNEASLSKSGITVIGADVDAREQYPEQTEYVLTSALKDIKSSTQELLHIWGVEKGYITEESYRKETSLFTPSIPTSKEVTTMNGKIFATQRSSANGSVGYQAQPEHKDILSELKVHSNEFKIGTGAQNLADALMDGDIDAVMSEALKLAKDESTYNTLSDKIGLINSWSKTFTNNIKPQD